MKPAGFPKAWPTKPRSVSPWPGLAGLKAYRLSAGRPGRLRTLADVKRPIKSLMMIHLKASQGPLYTVESAKINFFIYNPSCHRHSRQPSPP